ncbi:tetratricopeptide repeat protein [Amycolatopsis camponoti]|uniref:tetratricopeptide repeat protein n=1 Tax=Amycolatopsis camponoti TaxID=2606593 RepID=UPI001E30E5C3|nr:tetratricopeptide repeat protein [Amycolatopsis camponoti]
MSTVLVAVLAALVGNIATNTVVLPSGWSVVVWAAVVVLTVVSVVLAVRAHQTGQRRQLTDPAATGMSVRAGERSVAAAGDVGAAATGDNSFAVNVTAEHVLPAQAYAPMEVVSVPRGLTNLPPRPDLFVGRSEVLQHLDPTTTACVVVQGLGGIGKSTLAAHWAATRRPPFTLVWWITADTPAGVDTGLAELAAALQPGLATLLPAEALQQRAVQWLGSHSGWLVVLDNVTDPTHIAGLVGQVRTGRFLITSRRGTGWHGIATPITLGVLDPAEAKQLLVSILTHDPARAINHVGAEQVCAVVGYLPLAIEQIGAYCAETAITPTAYLDLLAQYPASMLAATTQSPSSVGASERSVAQVWRITLDHLVHLDPLTGQILRILAWWAPTDIPRTLLDELADPPKLLHAVGLLATYSMITLDEHAISVHRLVQTLARTPDPTDSPDPHRRTDHITQARDHAATFLNDALPDHEDPRTWPQWRRLLPHIDALTRHATLDTITTADLLNEAATFLADQGNLIQARAYFHRAYTSRERILGSDHPDTLAARSNLATAYVAAGDLGRAISLHRQILADRERVLGAKHPHTQRSRDRLANAYGVAGDLGRAIPLYQQTLADNEEMLGALAPDTISSRDYLAGAYRAAGDLDQAISLYQQALADSERTLGVDHVDTQSTRINLAKTYEAAGDLSQAIPLLQQTVADQERVLGADHPQTLNSRNNLATAYEAAGDLSQAIPLHQQTLADRERVLGVDHPDTLSTRNNLAYAYQAAGDLGQAVSHYQQTLADRERVLGVDHPATLDSRNNLAGAYEAAGDLDQAIPLFERTLADRERVLGVDHPDTLNSRNNLAYAYQAAGDLGRAIPLFEQTLADIERTLGADNPNSPNSRNNLACAYQAAGDLDQAIPLYEQALVDSERLLGVEHSLTETIRAKLSAAVGSSDIEPFG